MHERIRISVLGLALVVAGCGGDQEDVEAIDTMAQDTASIGAPSAGPPGGMGQMPGMGPGMMDSEWQEHMATMHDAAGDSLRAMMPIHRQMVTRMMGMMDGRMGMEMDSTWTATRDSLRQDMDRMQEMTPAEMEAFLDEHDARMQRMLQMHQSSP